MYFRNANQIYQAIDFAIKYNPDQNILKDLQSNDRKKKGTVSQEIFKAQL
jgi:hypothetical protein